jgi:hypothetical protein
MFKGAEDRMDEYSFSELAQPVRTLTKPTEEQMVILKALRLRGVLSPGQMNLILTSQSHINLGPPAESVNPSV